MGDVREMMALFVPGAVQADGTPGGHGDARQMLAGAMAGIEPRWSVDLLLAKYTDDAPALKTVQYAALIELAGMVWPRKGFAPGTLRKLANLAVAEHMHPPRCLSCEGTGTTYRLINGALTRSGCGQCFGRGRRRYTAEENEQQSGLSWGAWGHDYTRLARLLRRLESSATHALGEHMAGA